MMGDSTRSSSSGLASLSRGKRSSSSPSTLSGDEAGTMLSGESLSSSLSILRGQKGSQPCRRWPSSRCHPPPPMGLGGVQEAGGSPNVLGLVVRGGGQSRQQVQALHLHSRRVCGGEGRVSPGSGVPQRWWWWWWVPCHLALSKLTFLAVGLAGRLGVLGLLAQLLGGRDAVHHLLLHGGGRRGGQRGGRRGWVAEVVLRVGGTTAGREHAAVPRDPPRSGRGARLQPPPHLGE